MSKRSGKTSSHITYEDNNEELIDEINAFHAKDRAIDPKSLRKKKVWDRPEEVLNVEAEASDSSDEEDESDFDDDEDTKVTDNKWGKKRKDFYGTGYVDKEWGGMREEEMEHAELEEEDALTRQKNLDKSTAAIADIFDDDEEDEVEEVTEIETQFDFNEENAKLKHKKLDKLIAQYAARKRIYELVVKPLDSVLEKMPNCALRSQIVYVARTYAVYLMNVAFIIKLRASQFTKENLDDPLVDIHPAFEALKRLNKKIEACENFLNTHSEELDELKSWAKSSPEKIEELCTKISGVSLSKKAHSDNSIGDHCESAENGVSSMYTTLDSEEKRKADDRIAKNKQLRDKKGKKKAKTSKTKNRKRVHEIQKRVKSQVGVVRRELQKYSGEASGIRAATIKSTKLIA
ncbi:unnamed protein product [Caenorhabditis bovis]|uniref:Sas10 C-terminal domain-containing protein n=1 Tax=Caenorhabditis bovis TaxID=2654633 RepID=A0A8S1EX34_9PELO|nr:unnamed protein product [Caenorhabditis bovis]